MGKTRKRKGEAGSAAESHFPVLQKILEGLLAQLIVFVVGSGLVGGSSYLLLRYRAERIDLDRRIQEFGTSAAELKLGTQMSEAFTQDTSDLDRLDGTLVHLSRNISVRELSPEYGEASRRWILSSLSRLDEAEGTVQGYTFSTKVLEDLQRDELRVFAAERDLLDQVRTFIDSWPVESEAQRRARFVSIEAGARKGRIALYSLRTRLQQALELGENREKGDRLRYSRLIEENRAITRKAELSLAGIVFGALLIAGSILAFVITRVRRST